MSSRLTTSFWVAAYARRLSGVGLPVLMVRRGAAEGGAVFIRLDLERGFAAVLRPAIAATLDAGGADERRFSWALGPAPHPEAEVADYLARQLSYDPDAWVVAIDDAAGRHLLGEALVTD